MRKIAFVFSMVLFSLLAFAQAQFVEGKHYEVVAEKKSEKPMVREFFSLYCGHCFQFDPFIETLHEGLPEEVSFERSHVDYIPRDNKAVSFGMVKAYNVMIDLGMEEKLRRSFFAAIHVKGEAIDTEAKIKQVFLEQGVSSSKYDELYNSQSVIDRATVMTKLWVERKIESVPTLVINEKYKINMGSLKSMEELNAITDYLLKQK